MAIRNRFKILLAQKELNDGRDYTYNDISETTGLSTRTIMQYAKGRISRFDESSLVALCDWFECDLSELIQYPPVKSRQTLTQRVAVAA